MKRRTERCSLKVTLSIQNTAATLQCLLLSVLYNARFEITASGAVTSGGSPGLNIHCGLYPQNTKLCYLVTWVWLYCHSAHINVAILHLHGLRGLMEVLRLKTPHFILNYIIPPLFNDLCRNMQILAISSQVDVSVLWPILQSETNCSLTAPWWESAFDFSSAFCSWRGRFEGDSWQFEPSAEGGQWSAWSSLNRWVEMNNSTMSVWVASASRDLIVSECRVHLAWPSLAVSVCNLASVCLNTQPCRLWNPIRCSVSALFLQPC